MEKKGNKVNRLSEIRLKPSPWMELALDYLSHRTGGMDHTNIARLALLEYIQKRFTNYDFETLQHERDGMYIDALDSWCYWNLHLQHMPKEQSDLWKELAIKSLEYLRKKKRLPQFRELYKLGRFDKLEHDYEMWLHDFLNYQDKIMYLTFEDLPWPEKDNHKHLLDQGKESEYYNKRWGDYAEILIKKMGNVANPLFQVLYAVKRENHLIDDQQTALYLLATLLKNKGIKVKTKPDINGLMGIAMDPGEIARLLSTGKINENETLGEAIERRALEDWEKEIKETQDSIEKAEKVMKNLNKRSYNLSKLRAKQFKDKQEGKPINLEEENLAQKLIMEGKDIEFDPSKVDEDILIKEISRIEEQKKKEGKKKKDEKK